MINENTAVLMCCAHIFGPDKWRKSSSSFLVFFFRFFHFYEAKYDIHEFSFIVESRMLFFHYQLLHCDNM